MSDSEAKDQRVQNSPDAVGQNVPEAADRDLNELVLVPAGENTPRGSPGERLHHLFEQRCDSFEQQEMTAGNRIALPFDKFSYPYVGLSAVMKIGTAYVPLHASLPAERIGFISEGAVVETVREIEYTDTVIRETARREALMPLSRPG